MRRVTRPRSRSASALRCLASAITSIVSAAIWVVKALVEATPISGPARVSITRSDSRTSELSGTLQIDSVDRNPSCFASRSAASVSAVSPDCEMRDEQRVRRHDGIAVAELARDLHVAGNPAHLLDEVPGHGAGVEARAAGDDVHRPGPPEDFRGVRAEGGCEQPAVGDALLERLRHRARLLVDFLEHVVRVLALVGRIGGELAFLGRAMHRLADRSTTRTLRWWISATSPSSRKMNRRVTGSRADTSDATKFSPVPESNHDRAPTARNHQVSGVCLAHDDERVGALELGDSGADGFEQAGLRLEVIMDPVGDALGVGIRGEAVAELLQLVAQFLVVLDDAVVDDRKTIVGDVRVRVALTRNPVCRPARVGDADMGIEGLPVERRLELGDLALPPLPAHDAIVEDREAGRVVTAVFQAPQALHQDGHDVALGDGSYDSAHDG